MIQYCVDYGGSLLFFAYCLSLIILKNYSCSVKEILISFDNQRIKIKYLLYLYIKLINIYFTYIHNFKKPYIFTHA